MSALDKKLTRDLWRLKGQVATIALVLACGIMSMIMLRSTWQSLIGARDEYYEQHRFADVFARLERAPLGVAAQIEKLPGVAVVETRIVKEVMVPLAGEPDPVAGRIVSLPDTGKPVLNDVYLRRGRMPAGADEAVVLEQFAIAHRMDPGARLPVVINGKLRSILVVGIALSPEYVLAMSGREMAPDPKRFVVLWMPRQVVAPAFRMDGAFNDVSLRLEPHASLPAVLEAVDHELERYGGLHATGRDKQLSNYALTSELGILRALALMIPAVFLAVAAFLVNVVVSRLVFLERTQIAVLKALGFGDGRIARHYLSLVALVVAIAAVVGIAFGVWSGRWMTNLYAEFYRFPTHAFHVSMSVVAITVGIGLASAVVGALSAVRKIARMPPAEAMRPPAPLNYRRTLLDRLGIGRVIGPSAMIVVREIRRRPFRFVMSTAGIAMGVAIFVMGRFSVDSFDYLMSDVFPRQYHEDLTVTLAHPVSDRALRELEHVPGVELAEGQRMVPVRFHASSRWRDGAMIGLPARSELRVLLAGGTTKIELPPQGLVMTDKLAELLGVRVGDAIEVDLLEGKFGTRTLPIAGLIDESFGLQAYARADWLARVLREDPRVSIILLRVDRAHFDVVRARLKELPAVIGVTSRDAVQRSYEEQTGESMVVMTLILTLSAAAIAIGVVYNNARIALSLRSRDLATLRVLGFTRVEISSMLLGELAAQVLVGIPLGLWLGLMWSYVLAASIDPETIRFPVHISGATYVYAALIALVSGLVSSLLVRHKLDHLDLVAVLKSSE
ncbi:MAG TPA: FtsX-like permease family protein [Kofleriaceae bacterium]